MSNTNGSITKPLTDIIEALAPLTPDERRRTLEAALMFLGESVAPAKPKAAKRPYKRGNAHQVEEHPGE